MAEYCKEDLAYIHGLDHSDFASKSAPGLPEILARSSIREGLVVDLGCRSGLWAQELAKAHYRLLGIETSEAIIRNQRSNRTRTPPRTSRGAPIVSIGVRPTAYLSLKRFCTARNVSK